MIPVLISEYLDLYTDKREDKSRGGYIISKIVGLFLMYIAIFTNQRGISGAVQILSIS